MLAEMLLWGNLLELRRVGQSWRAVILSMPRMWSAFRLSTWTKPDKRDFIMARSGIVPLDVEIDARGRCIQSSG
jgi:hypothetical protein